MRDEKAISEMKQVRLLELDAWCTSRGQAQRAGLWALKSEQLETRTVTFKVGLDGHIPLPGKVIEFADPILLEEQTVVAFLQFQQIEKHYS